MAEHNDFGRESEEAAVHYLEDLGYNILERNFYWQNAEIQAITAASEFLGGKYLKNCTLYITLEPCVMCAGALYWSQIGKIVCSARDEKRGYHLYGNLLHPKTEIVYGILEKESSELLKNFFLQKRFP